MVFAVLRPKVVLATTEKPSTYKYLFLCKSLRVPDIPNGRLEAEVLAKMVILALSRSMAVVCDWVRQIRLQLSVSW